MLETYIGTKIVQGEPQTCQKDSHNSKVGDPGYKVVYEDGYISWSPKDVFEAAYHKIDELNLERVIDVMRQRLKVRFPEWDDNISLEFAVVCILKSIEEGRIGPSLWEEIPAKKFKYRDHKGSLEESLKTVQEFNNRTELVDYLKTNLPEIKFSGEDVSIDPYTYDERLKWDVHVVTISGDAVGFTNGPVD